MALGYMMLSMPTALLGSCLVCAQHGYGAGQALVIYSVIGTLILIAASLYYGAEQQ